VGHKVLHNIHRKQIRKSHYCSYVPLFNIAILKLRWSHVTLRIRPRLNGWYGIKVMAGMIIWHIEKDIVVKSL